MEKIAVFLKTLDHYLLLLLKAIAILCFILLTVLISANVFVRFVPIMSLHWFDEIIELLYAFMIFYGTAALWITREHIKVGDWISGRLLKGPTAIKIYRLILEGLGLVFTLIFLFYSFRLTNLALDVTNVFALPKKILYSCMPISGLIMVVYSLRNIAMEILNITPGRQP